MGKGLNDVGHPRPCSDTGAAEPSLGRGNQEMGRDSASVIGVEGGDSAQTAGVSFRNHFRDGANRRISAVEIHDNIA